MSRPSNKQGFRPVTSGNVRYRWRCSYDNRAADLEVHLETATSARRQRLCVDVSRSLFVTFDKKIVSQIISSAIAHGWRPHELGDDYRVMLKEISPAVQIEYGSR